MWTVTNRLGTAQPVSQRTAPLLSGAIELAKIERDFYRGMAASMGGGIVVTGNIQQDKKYQVWDVTKSKKRILITEIILERG